jgi:hypothetical protein
MAFLTAHLRRTDEHARLRFHPECPICRGERHSGALAADALVARRGRALLAASVLALSAAAPTAALAAGPEPEQEGTTAPEQILTDDVASTPDFDTGGPVTELPYDAGAAPDDTLDTNADEVPLEQEPATGDPVPAAIVGDGTGTESVEQQPQPRASEPLPPPPAAEPVSPAPPLAVPVPEAPTATNQEQQVASSPPPPADEHLPRGPEHTSVRSNIPAVALPQSSTPGPAPQPEPASVGNVISDSSTARLTRSTATHREAAQPANPFHVVQRGESLWSIANDLLGNDASVARIAREVNRLWELNSARIGTGDRDLLMAGTKLALR